MWDVSAITQQLRVALKERGWFADNPENPHVPGANERIGGPAAPSPENEYRLESHERYALERLKAGESVKVEIMGHVVAVVADKLTGKVIRNKTTNGLGIVLGLRQGSRASDRYAYIVRIAHVTYNASRNGFKIMEDGTLGSLESAGGVP